MRAKVSHILLLLAIGAAPVRSENSPASVKEFSDVTLVEVPAYVTGRDGKPVRGLVKEDFTVEDDGKPQAVTAVDEVDLDRSAPLNVDEIPLAERRRFLFLFDLSFASPSSLMKARAAAIDFTARGLLPEDFVGVATTSVETGPRLVLNFTADRAQLLAALRAVGIATQIDRERDPLGFAFMRPGDPNGPIPLAGNGDIKLGGTDEFTVLQQMFKTMAQKTSDRYAVTRIERHLEGMGSLAKALDMIEGRKTIVFFSQGFDSSLLTGSNGANRQEEDYNDEAMLHGMFWMTDVDKRFADAPLNLLLKQTLEVFQRSDCVVYAVDIAGLKSEEGQAAAGQINQGSDALYEIASGTGGEVIDHSNDLVRQLGRIESRTRHFYVLSFQPAVTRRPGGFHRLRVRVHHSGYRVSARAGYFESRRFEELSPLERALSAADIISHADAKGDFAIRTRAVPFLDGKDVRTNLFVQIPPHAFVANAGGGEGPIGLYVYATNREGRLVDYVTRLLRISDARQIERVQNGVLYSGVLRLVPGTYRVHTLVRDESNGRFGLSVEDVQVPDFSDRKITLLAPLFLEEANSAGLRLREGGSPTEALLSVSGEDLSPEPSPEVAQGGRVRVCLLAYGLGSSGRVEPFRIDAWIRSADGRLVPAPISLVGRLNPGADGMTKLLVELSTADLEAGVYALRVTMHDSNNPSRTETSETSFRVL